MSAAGPDERPVILVVDDDPGVSMLLHLGLPKYGFDALTAGNLAEALALFRREQLRIDLALIDLHMPDGNGLEVVRQLRALDPGVRCCFMSGGFDMPTADELRDLKISDLILKPFHWAELVARLRTCLEAPRPDRRRHARLDSQDLAVVVITTNGSAGHELPARVRNRSAGGLRLCFSGTAPASDRFRVRPENRPDADAVEVEVRHRQACNGGWLVGCGFADPAAAVPWAALD